MSRTLPTQNENLGAHQRTFHLPDLAALSHAEGRIRLHNPSLGSRLLIGTAAFLLGGCLGLTAMRVHDNPGVLSVNGHVLRRQELDHRCEIAAAAPVLRQWAAQDLQTQFAEEMGATPTGAEVDAKYAQLAKQPDYAQRLAATRQTPEDVKQDIRASLAQQNVLTQSVTVTDTDIQNFYKTNTDPKNPNARYYRPEMVQVAAIITNSPADIHNALHDLASGQPFAAVARKYSKDKSAADGGLLPPIRRGQLDPAKFPGAEATLFGLQPGQQIDTLNMAGALWIVRCVGRAAQVTAPFDQVKDECRTGALLAKGMAVNGQTMQAKFAAFQKAAQIKAISPEFQPLVDPK